MNRRQAVNAALVLFGLLLFGWRLGGHDLWPPDEPRFGLVAREMLERGDPVVLSRNGRLYTDKPPLFFWAIDAGAMLLRGGQVDEAAARLPSLLGSVLALLLVARLGTRLYDRTTGVLGAILFATSMQILERARWASIDMTLNFFVLAAIVLFWEEVERARHPEVEGARAPAGSGARGGRWRAVVAWGAMGLATLAKGPVGLVMPLLAIVPALVLLRRAQNLRRLVPIAGIALYLLVVAGWFVPFSLRLGFGEAVHIATHQTVERYVNAWNAQHPVWYYAWRFPAGFMPWSFFLPAALIAAFGRRRQGEGQDGAPDRAERTAAIFLTAWMAAILIFFSFSTGKRGVYVIPIYPAAALLVARLFTRDAHRVLATRSARVFALFAFIIAAALPVAVPRKHPEFRTAALAVGALLLAAGAVALWGASRRLLAVPWGIAAAMSVLMLVACEIVLPLADRHMNLSGFAAEVTAARDPAVPLGATEEKREVWVFYLRTTVEELDTPEQILHWIGEGPDRDLLIEEELYRDIAPRLPPDVRILHTGRVSGRPYHLLARRISGAQTDGAPPAGNEPR
ncbi:MAG TPA: glycosyltransferase family 39 protein [Verrucomicrobiae bacterium]|nr:glycosyltransferase family 39 protein [Verrucomicrobiae bacterium]